MLIAYDKDDNKIHINDTKSNQAYYCPYCGTELITRKGDIRMHHFAHKRHACSDSWEREGSYDMSPWHSEWQSQFPIDNQEVPLTLGETRHRADVLIDKTVIEFQHSILLSNAFDNRNNFYQNLGYKVVWLFDIEDLINDEKITYTSLEDTLQMKWNNPKKAFNAYDVQEGKIDLFFQLYDVKEKENCIVRVLNVSDFGFESFTTTKLMSKDDFLYYVGLIDGKCKHPDRMDTLADESYQNFKKKFNIKLNKQQERAMLSVEGNNLLLAVPGSGKTTVLVQRLGYMVLEKHINPKDILCLTFGNNAKNEMETRFIEQFEIDENNISFSTINALSMKIYKDFCSKTKTQARDILEGKKDYSIKRNILSKKKTFVSSDDVTEFSSAISYVKNMMYSKEKIKSIDSYISSFSTMFEEYNKELEAESLMDFDDQMIFAYEKINEDTEFAKEWKSKYKYICVDEAQDTSKIQHSLIRLLAENNNLFMVGDEDQSIYGFRAAYPKALLNFRTDYKNPYILKMETNYRCTPEIVEIAQKFISKNTGRYEKKMKTINASGTPVELLRVNSFEEQYNKCLEVAKTTNKELAFLYRDNVSAIVLVDLLLRNNISFTLKKPEYNFFNGVYVGAMIGCLKLAVDSKKYNDEVLKLKKAGYLGNMHDTTLRYLSNDLKFKDLYTALNKQNDYVKQNYKHEVINLIDIFEYIKSHSPYEAIKKIIDFYHKGYISNDYMVLLELAKREKDIKSFIDRLNILETKLKNDINDSNNRITLSTIHTAKGKEFNSVYIIDVYDDRFPTSKHNYFNGSKDAEDGEQEERRLFYVALTRAKEKLTLFAIKDKYSSYIEELFPNQQEQKIAAIPVKIMPFNHSVNIPIEESRSVHLNRKITTSEETEQNEIAIPKKTKEEKEAEQKKLDEECLEEVKGKLNQQEEQVFDHTGRRWIKCEMCGLIAPVIKFSSYGGFGKLNLGTCPECMEKKYSNL